MSKTVRKQIFQKLEELCRKNQVISKEKTSADLGVEALADCQNMAVDLGRQIEMVYGEEHQSVHALEDYCEAIYQIAVEKEVRAKKRLACEADKILQDVSHYIEREIPDKLEVVFLPYKASMWDSLESIWLAAREDAACDAYVIPIPYYDKNPDGSFAVEHYEGEDYPDYVPVVRYDAYDFEVRKPDIVFIHNPYDQCNHVTSVHPFFYTKNINKFTERLVYVPYFVLNEETESEDLETEEIKKFCLTPGVFHSKKVIVQSERMRKKYIEILIEASGKGEATRKYWENKILGMGSPKEDRLYHICEKNVIIPDEWEKILKEDGGKKKKIIFYNTSVIAFLENGADMLKKIEQVFKLFQSKRHDVVLIWRPHPLLESSIASMRPELLNSYKKLREKYKKDGWGIYDDTADMNTAIALSDGYYGDMSSVAYLYTKVAKPVLIQNSHQVKWVFAGCVLVNQEIYFCLSGYNMLLKYDLCKGTVNTVAKLWEKEEKISSIAMMESDGENIYMLEMTGERVLRYSLVTHQCEKVIIACNQDRYNNFAAITKYGKSVYIFPRLESYIVKIENGKNVVRMAQALYHDLNQMNYEAPYFSYGIQRKNEMWLVGEQGRIIVCYQLNSDQYTIYDCPKIEEGCIHAIFFEESIYILSVTGKVYKWQKEQQEITQIIDLKADVGQYARLVVLKNKIVILPQTGEDILIYNLHEKSVSTYEQYPDDFKYQILEGGTKYSDYCENDQYVYFAMQSANYLLMINKQTEKIEWKKMKLDESMAERYMEGNGIREEGMIQIRDYLNWIIEKYNKDSCEKQDFGVGKSIWEEVGR